MTYLWYHYRNYLIGIIFFIVFLIFAIQTLANRTEVAFNIAVVSLDLSEETIENIQEDVTLIFDEELDVNQQVSLSVANEEFSMNRFLAEWTSASYDIILIHPYVFDELKENDTFAYFKINDKNQSQTINEDQYSPFVPITEVPFFDNYPSLNELYVAIPENIQDPYLLEIFFNKQDLVLDIQT